MGEVRKPSLLISFLCFFIGLLLILMGLFGYRYYDRVISKHMPVFFCVIPAMTLAAAFLALGIIINRLRIRKIVPSVTPVDAHNAWIPPELKKKNRQEAIDRLKVKRKEMRSFLRDIKEQKKDGLITPGTYKKLQTNYSLQLRVVEGALGQLEEHNGEDEE